MENLNQVQWPEEVNQKIIDHIFGGPVSPEVAQNMGLYDSANKLYTKLVVRDIERQGFTNQQRAEQGLYTRQGEVPYDLVYTKEGYSAVKPGESPHISGTTNLESPTSGPGFALDYNEKGDVVAVPVKQMTTLSSGSAAEPVPVAKQETPATPAPAPAPAPTPEASRQRMSASGPYQERALYERFKNAPSRPRMMDENEEDEEDLPKRKRTRKVKSKSKNKFSLRNLFGRKEKASKGTKGTPRYL